jgi:hypothetical protein
MNDKQQKILLAVGEIICQIRREEQDILDIAEDQEKQNARENVYDLEQVSSLINRTLSR